MTATAERTARTVNLVITCAHRKSQAVPDRLRLRSVKANSPQLTATRWVERLEHVDTVAITGGDLYAGEHWSVIASLEAIATNRQVKLSTWICSAGYGLVPLSAPLKPYSATFSAGHPDSVPGAPSRWWQQLATWHGPLPGIPRTLGGLARKHPRSVLLLALSAPYLKACQADAAEAAAVLRGRLGIISAGTRAGGQLAPHFLPTDARLQHALGGTRQALNARIVSRILSETNGSLSIDHWRQSLVDLLALQPELPTYNRERLTDDQVRAFIRERLTADGPGSHSRLLAELRASGHACEQSRFAALFTLESSRC